MIPLETKPSLYLPELGLHLDSLTSQKFGFISHAHADHVGSHETILCSPVTAVILRARYRFGKKRFRTLEFQTPLELKGYRIELLPAGHITGSAMLHITRLSDGATLLYTGDCKTRDSLTAEAIVIKPANQLIIESTFANPIYTFPAHSETSQQLVHFVQQALTDGVTPILIAYALGKAQEAHAILSKNNIYPVLHHATAKMALTCIKAGVNLGDYGTLEELAPDRHCLIIPPGYLKHPDIASIKHKRTAMLTGWALDPDVQYKRRGIDAFIPLSDHADYPGLLEIIERVNPRDILTVHGSTKSFATDLRRRGYNAWSIEGEDQIELF